MNTACTASWYAAAPSSVRLAFRPEFLGAFSRDRKPKAAAFALRKRWRNHSRDALAG